MIFKEFVAFLIKIILIPGQKTLPIKTFKSLAEHQFSKTFSYQLASLVFLFAKQNQTFHLNN